MNDENAAIIKRSYRNSPLKNKKAEGETTRGGEDSSSEYLNRFTFSPSQDTEWDENKKGQSHGPKPFFKPFPPNHKRLWFQKSRTGFV